MWRTFAFFCWLAESYEITRDCFCKILKIFFLWRNHRKAISFSTIYLDDPCRYLGSLQQIIRFCVTAYLSHWNIFQFLSGANVWYKNISCKGTKKQSFADWILYFQSILQTSSTIGEINLTRWTVRILELHLSTLYGFLPLNWWHANGKPRLLMIKLLQCDTFLSFFNVHLKAASYPTCMLLHTRVDAKIISKCFSSGNNWSRCKERHRAIISFAFSQKRFLINYSNYGCI